MSKKKPSAARIAKQVSESLSRALAGIDLANIGKPKKTARRDSPPRRRKPTAPPKYVQQPLFDKGGTK